MKKAKECAEGNGGVRLQCWSGPPPRQSRKLWVGFWLSAGFGLFEGAYTSPAEATDGERLSIKFVAEDGTRETLLVSELHPRDEPGDWGFQIFRVNLAEGVAGCVEWDVSEGA